MRKICLALGIAMGIVEAAGCGSETPKATNGATSSSGSSGSGSASSGAGGGSSTCENGVKDEMEADVDCGVACPAKCGQGKECAQSADCESDFCEMDRCIIKPGSFVWVKTGGDQGSDLGQYVAVDKDGNVYVTGEFVGSINLGGADLTAGDALYPDIFVAKYAADGKHLWSKRFGGAGTDYGFAIAVDATGNVLVSGQFEQAVNFGGTDLVAQGNHDAYLVKLSSNGDHVWSKAYGSAGYDWGYSVAIDAAGNVYLSGLFDSTINFGGAPLTSKGGSDTFFLKVDPGGNHLWSKSYGGTDNDYGSSIDIDAAGNVYVAGYFQLTVDFGGGPLTSAGSGLTDRLDVYVAKFDASGSHVWSKGFGGPKHDYGYSVAVDKVNGNAYVTGYFASPTLNLGGADLVNAGDLDVFLAKFDASGAHVWSKSFGAAKEDRGAAITFDGVGNLYVTGWFGDSVDFGGGPLAAQGSTNVFVAAYDAEGTHHWSQRWGGPGAASAYSIDINSSGDLYITGGFFETVDFGGGPVAAKGGRDFFLLKIGENPPPIPN